MYKNKNCTFLQINENNITIIKYQINTSFIENKHILALYFKYTNMKD